MAKGWLGRSRAQSNAQQPVDRIGQPNLMWSDAEPRSDLQQLGQASATAPLRGNLTTGGERPRTAGEQVKPLPTEPFDMDLPRPKPSHFELRDHQEDSMIGMALGSPTQPAFRAGAQQIGQSPLGSQPYSPYGYDENSSDLARSKSGKWKKFGGLFKAKSALTSQRVPSPQFPGGNPTGIEGKSLPQEPVTSYPRQNFVIPDKAQRVMGNSAADMSQKGSKTSNESPQSQNRSRSKSDAKTHNSSNSKESNSSLKNNLAAFENSPAFLNGLPSLDIDIPDAHLERYSVMFGNILGKPNSSNLLARRSRMLDKLKTISDEAEKTRTEPMPPLPPATTAGLPRNPKDQDHLVPKKQPRRATSPQPANSPGLSLFPQPPSGGDRSHGPLPPGKNGPLQRSFTAPGRLSPRRQEFDFGITQTIPEQDGELVDSPGQTTGSTRPKWSSDGSFLSPASTSSSVSQEIFLFDVKALSYLNENNEPQWEMVSTENLNDMKAGVRRNRRADPRPSPLAEIHSQSPEPSGPSFNDDALARLEAPPPRGQDLAPLRATKAAVDRLMSPPPRDRNPLPALPSKATEEARQVKPLPLASHPVENSPKNITMPKLKVRNRDNSNPQPPPLVIPATQQTSPSIEHLMTALTNDLDDLEQQIESRAMRAYQNQVKQVAPSPVQGPTPTPAVRRNPPMRSATEDSYSRTEQRPGPGLARQATAPMNKTKSLDSIIAAANMQPPLSPKPPMPSALGGSSPLDIVRSLSPVPTGPDHDDDDGYDDDDYPSFLVTSPGSVTSPVEVKMARSISVSKRQRHQLVPVNVSKTQSEENLVEKTAQGPLTPQIIDAQSTASVGRARGHRYERSQNAVLESA